MNRFHNPHLSSSAFRHSFSLLTSHISLLTFLFVLPAFSQQNWSRTYGGRWDDEAYSVRQTFDGGYVVAGWRVSFILDTLPDVYLIKINAMGDTLWTKDYQIRGTDYGYAVWQTSDSSFIITGCKDYTGLGKGDVYLIKTNSSGDTLWTRTFGGAGWDEGFSVKQTSDGGYIVAGWKTSVGDSTQVYLIKTNPFGDTLWTRTYGGTNAERGYSAQQTSDGGYIIAGYTNSFGAGRYDFYVIKIDAQGGSGIEEANAFNDFWRGAYSATPNPFVSFARVPGHEAERFALYDISGRKVGTYKGDRIGEGLTPGVYFLRPESGEARPLRVVKIR